MPPGVDSTQRRPQAPCLAGLARMGFSKHRRWFTPLYRPDSERSTARCDQTVSMSSERSEGACGGARARVAIRMLEKPTFAVAPPQWSVTSGHR